MTAILDSLWRVTEHGPVEPRGTGVGQTQIVLVSTIVQTRFGVADSESARFSVD